jgi:hypothetical protein
LLALQEPGMPQLQLAETSGATRLPQVPAAPDEVELEVEEVEVDEVDEVEDEVDVDVDEVEVEVDAVPVPVEVELLVEVLEVPTWVVPLVAVVPVPFEPDVLPPVEELPKFRPDELVGPQPTVNERVATTRTTVLWRMNGVSAAGGPADPARESRRLSHDSSRRCQPGGEIARGRIGGS